MSSDKWILDSKDRSIVAGHMRRISIDNLELDPDRASRFRIESERFEKCGEIAIVNECRACRHKFQTRLHCKSRICEKCGRIYYRRIVSRMREQVKALCSKRKKGFFTSMITLTVQTDRFEGRAPNRSDIARIYRESSQFFRLFCGKFAAVRTKQGKIREDRKRYRGAGSIAAVEVAPDNNNLHIHAVVYMPFTPMSVLKREWLRITGDSHVLRIDPERNPRRLVNYILKYVTKPPGADSYAGIADFAWMIKGSRRLRTTGIFYNQFPLARHDGLKCRCPYCSSKLYLFQYCDRSELDHTTPELWPLLRLVADRGENLLPPAWSWMWGLKNAESLPGERSVS